MPSAQLGSLWIYPVVKPQGVHISFPLLAFLRSPRDPSLPPASFVSCLQKLGYQKWDKKRFCISLFPGPHSLKLF